MPEVTNNYKLGSKVVMSKHNDLYISFIHSDNDNPGRIHFTKHGTENNIFYNWEIARNKKFQGEFEDSNQYATGDIVYLES